MRTISAAPTAYTVVRACKGGGGSYGGARACFKRRGTRFRHAPPNLRRRSGLRPPNTTPCHWLRGRARLELTLGLVCAYFTGHCKTEPTQHNSRSELVC